MFSFQQRITARKTHARIVPSRIPVKSPRIRFRLFIIGSCVISRKGVNIILIRFRAIRMIVVIIPETKNPIRFLCSILLITTIAAITPKDIMIISMSVSISSIRPLRLAAKTLHIYIPITMINTTGILNIILHIHCFIVYCELHRQWNNRGFPLVILIMYFILTVSLQYCLYLQPSFYLQSLRESAG